MAYEKLLFTTFKASNFEIPNCYGSVKMIRFSYSNEDTKDEERRRLNLRQTAKHSTKRQSRTLFRDHAITHHVTTQILRPPGSDYFIRFR
jgi:hypothetical protein